MADNKDAPEQQDIINFLKSQINDRDEIIAKLKEELRTVKYLLHQHESNIRGFAD